MPLKPSLLITGAAGFIGSHFTDFALKQGNSVIALDCLNYASNKENLVSAFQSDLFHFVEGNILDSTLISKLLNEHSVTAVINFAAESHVDRSILDASAFIQTNVVGTYTLLKASLDYFLKLDADQKTSFRFLQISTDEVFGSLGTKGSFYEESPYRPNSPYAASKASADHLVRAWQHTYQLPTIITHASNNFGPRQFEEKLIPKLILNAIKEKPLPLYGKGEQIRDWIYVEDAVSGIYKALINGQIGKNYCFGASDERTNLNVAVDICSILDEKHPRSNQKNYSELITFVDDRPGHDFRYSLDSSLAQAELGFNPQKNFKQALESTIDWYLKKK